jgi:nucleotide-binding universal stress UspA family protein
MIKDILVNLSVGKSPDHARDYAISVASLFDAHLCAAAFAYEFPAWAMEGMTASMIESWSAERRAEAETALKTFDECIRQRRIRSDCRLLSDMLGNPARAFSEIARSYDLAVLAQHEATDEVREDLLIEAALFDSGRPVLLVPFTQTTRMKLDRIIVCWNGSKNAARAIGDAMPFLKRAGKITILSIEPRELSQALRGTQIAEHLARHGLDVEFKPVVAPDIRAAEIILNEAADSGADLIVMGAYGHTRLREFVLGGVTHSMLQTMTAPVLMSH